MTLLFSNVFMQFFWSNVKSKNIDLIGAPAHIENVPNFSVSPNVHFFACAMRISSNLDPKFKCKSTEPLPNFILFVSRQKQVWHLSTQLCHPPVHLSAEKAKWCNLALFWCLPSCGLPQKTAHKSDQSELSRAVNQSVQHQSTKNIFFQPLVNTLAKTASSG